MNDKSIKAIEVAGLDFAYDRKIKILSGINLNVTRGTIYGFLGKNGAGKSTTLRTILGLMKPQQGSISILGESIRKAYPGRLKKIGSLIESPSLYGHLTAAQNLSISCKYFGISNRNIDPALNTVNLTYARNMKVKRFSTGMKQRLGLAIAMLQDPEILILDEPTNGLDPTGMIEFRDILMKLKANGKTIMLSSHILSEVEKIASHIGIIHDGKMVFEGDLSALNQMKHLQIEFRVSDSTKAKEVLGMEHSCEEMGEQCVVVEYYRPDQIPNMVNKLVEGGIEIFSAIPLQKDLEEMFLSITARGIES